MPREGSNSETSLPNTTHPMSKKIFITLIINLFVLLNLYAQSDSTLLFSDSLLNKKLAETALELKQSRQQFVTDSVRKAELEKEISELKANDQLKRDELQTRIRKIDQEDSLRSARQKKRLTEMKSITQGFPVNPFGDTLFFVFNRIGPFSPLERALRIKGNIEKIYRQGSYIPADLKIVEGESTMDIHYHDLVLMSISDMDALWKDSTKAELAYLYRNTLNQAIEQETENNSLKNILIRIAEVIMVILGIWLLLFLLNKLFYKSRQYIETRLDKKISSVKLKDYELLSGVRILQTTLWLHNMLRIGAIALSLYLALPLLFSIFPSTKPWGDKLIDWIISPVINIGASVLAYLPNLFTIIVVFMVIRYVIRFVRFLANEIEQGKLVLNGFHQEWAKPTFNIVRALLYVFMFIIIFPYLPGSDSPVFKGVSVFLGILFSLGSSSAISNAVAGLVITYMRPFKIGDRVKINDISGNVVEKTLLVTRIRTTKNEEITIPNSAILSGHTVNYTSTSLEQGLIIYSTVTIGYDVPWKNVHKALEDAALRTILVLKTPKPFVLQTSLDDYYVAYQINAYIREVNQQPKIYSELHQHIQDVFNERGIEILSPHYRAMRDGNTAGIPASYLPEDYEAPHFRIKTENNHSLPDDENILLKGKP